MRNKNLALIFSSLVIGLTITAVSFISSADHETATAALTPSISSGDYPLSVNFNIQVSPASSGACAPDNYVLRFGDGSSSSGDSRGPLNVSHVYAKPGLYVAELDYSMEGAHGGSFVICSPGSASANATINATIGQDLIASFEATQSDSEPPFDVQFNATSSSTDPACTPISSYSWNFGDGTSTGSGPLVNHAYENDGSYQVSLTVRDLCEREVTTTRNITIGDLSGDSENVDSPSPDGDMPEEIVLSTEQLQINDGVLRIFNFISELDINLNSTESLVRSFIQSNGEISDEGYQLIDAQVLSISDLIALTLVEIEQLEVLSEAQGTVFLTHLRQVTDLLLDEDFGIKKHIDRARQGTDDRDLERVQFELEDAISKFENGVIRIDSWSDLLEFDELYRCQGQLGTVLGGPFGQGPGETNIVSGTEGDDIIVGSLHKDQINGGGGNDLICGLPGDDVILGGAGDDTIYGQGGQDRIFGGSGSDEIWGGFHDDEIYGGDGADKIYAQSGQDEVYGGPGDDFIHGGIQRDFLHGEDGDDEMHASGGEDVLYGENDNDTLYASDGYGFLFGGLGDDHHDGRPQMIGSPTCWGGKGIDTQIGCFVVLEIP